MGLDKRLKRLEDAIPQDNGILLFTSSGKQVDGTITRKPTPERPGAALLADGSTRPIDFDAGWKDRGVVVQFDDTDAGGALVMRSETTTQIIIDYGDAA